MLDDAPEHSGLRLWQRPLPPSTTVLIGMAFGYVLGALATLYNFRVLGMTRAFWVAIAINLATIIALVAIFRSSPLWLAWMLVGPWSLPGVVSLGIQATFQRVRIATLKPPYRLQLLLVVVSLIEVLALMAYLGRAH
ncbi:MAG TPA: hypothetical protein V6D47_16450 [Oscillatoriaceae cyanobacterium]